MLEWAHGSVDHGKRKLGAWTAQLVVDLARYPALCSMTSLALLRAVWLGECFSWSLYRFSLQSVLLFQMKVGTEVLSVHACMNRLVGLVVRRPPWEQKIPGSNPACAGIFSGLSHTSDSKIGTPVATLPGAWHYRVSAGTGQPGISILWLGEVESWICNFYLSVAARKIVWADPSLRYSSLLLGR